MPTLDFGQPERGIIQMAYVVADIRAAMDQWTLDLHVGPWFLLDHFTGEDPTYRGAPSQAAVTLAMAFAGHMQIELLQPLDDHPSVYREAIIGPRLRLPSLRRRQPRFRGRHRAVRGARVRGRLPRRRPDRRIGVLHGHQGRAPGVRRDHRARPRDGVDVRPLLRRVARLGRHRTRPTVRLRTNTQGPMRFALSHSIELTEPTYPTEPTWRDTT